MARGRPAKNPKPIVTVENIESCLDILAPLVDGPRPEYLSLFKRLERERAKLQDDENAMERVRRRIARKAGAETHVS
jgi:hypothetical protein